VEPEEEKRQEQSLKRQLRRPLQGSDFANRRGRRLEETDFRDDQTTDDCKVCVVS
jgi:hypothetical protein